MNAPPDHITVNHGTLSVNVPTNIFKGRSSEFDEEKAKNFRDMIGRRYPWLSQNSLDLFMKHAQKEMARIIDEESGGRVQSRDLASKGKFDDAIKHLKRHLEADPEDADSWYTLGELLCKKGDVEEGYRAINRGRSLSQKKD